MTQSIAAVTLVVRDYDEAIAWFVERLGFALVEDSALSEGKRWVRVAPSGGTGTSLLLAKAVGAEQERGVGAQSGGRVFLFLETDDFERDHTRFRANGVDFLEEPRSEVYGTVAVFQDLYGNRWDLIEPAKES